MIRRICHQEGELVRSLTTTTATLAAPLHQQQQRRGAGAGGGWSLKQPQKKPSSSSPITTATTTTPNEGVEVLPPPPRRQRPTTPTPTKTIPSPWHPTALKPQTRPNASIFTRKLHNLKPEMTDASKRAMEVFVKTFAPMHTHNEVPVLAQERLSKQTSSKAVVDMEQQLCRLKVQRHLRYAIKYIEQELGAAEASIERIVYCFPETGREDLLAWWELLRRRQQQQSSSSSSSSSSSPSSITSSLARPLAAFVRQELAEEFAVGPKTCNHGSLVGGSVTADTRMSVCSSFRSTASNSEGHEEKGKEEEDDEIRRLFDKGGEYEDLRQKAFPSPQTAELRNYCMQRAHFVREGTRHIVYRTPHFGEGVIDWTLPLTRGELLARAAFASLADVGQRERRETDEMIMTPQEMMMRNETTPSNSTVSRGSSSSPSKSRYVQTRQEVSRLMSKRFDAVGRSWPKVNAVIAGQENHKLLQTTFGPLLPIERRPPIVYFAADALRQRGVRELADFERHVPLLVRAFEAEVLDEHPKIWELFTDKVAWSTNLWKVRKSGERPW